MKVRVPLAVKTVDGIDCPYPWVTLRVRDKFGTFAEIPFRVDTAADLTSIPIKRARREGIAYGESDPGMVHGLAGAIEKFRGQVHVVIAGKEHTWPCDFVKEPPPRQAGPPLPELTPVLGRAGLLSEYALCIDAKYLILTRRSLLSRWWRARLYQLWERLGLTREPDRPL